MDQQSAPTTNSIYAVFAGGIDTQAVAKFFNSMTSAQNIAQNPELHILFQSWGGNVSDGVCLYNFFRTFPVDLTLYNAGNVSSIATIAYLGAKKRKVSTYATFMIHRTTSPGQPATAERLNAIAHSVVADDQRTEAILRAHLSLSEDQWSVHRSADLFLTAKEAITCGLAELGEFAPPVGTRVFNI
ncbi:ATP-dependent Clp protease proteolytic subunit [Bradyrhizobium genosp. SA-3]|uniref:ATP-dependent Clp protease proteolytic subunit n=1 Tax=Bradyrhizobium genosp. SA-3 TaxID=508868 RepID=UPI0013EE7790|nr:ATP-dependent Clp protease proteolytic subunit [Bradyrhizobium genosp. SA-3]